MPRCQVSPLLADISPGWEKYQKETRALKSNLQSRIPIQNSGHVSSNPNLNLGADTTPKWLRMLTSSSDSNYLFPNLVVFLPGIVPLFTFLFLPLPSLGTVPRTSHKLSMSSVTEPLFTLKKKKKKWIHNSAEICILGYTFQTQIYSSYFQSKIAKSIMPWAEIKNLKSNNPCISLICLWWKKTSKIKLCIVFGIRVLITISY